MTWIAQAVKGSNEYDAVLRQALQIGLQERAGYVAPKLDTSNDVFQYTLDGSLILIEMDIQDYLEKWYAIMDAIVKELTGDEFCLSYGIDRLNRARVELERILNRANMRRVPPFWEYVFSVKHPDYFAPMDFSCLPEYPRNYDELTVLYEKYGVQP